MKSNKGFTLIEMVVVIAVLGVLMTMAAPRLMDTTSAAKKAVVGSVGNAIEKSFEVFSLHAGMPGADIESGKLVVHGEKININPVDSYPLLAKRDKKAVKQLGMLLNADVTVMDKEEGDYSYVRQGEGFKLFPKKVEANKACYVEYVPATEKGKAEFNTVDSDC